MVSAASERESALSHEADAEERGAKMLSEVIQKRALAPRVDGEST